MEIWIVLYSLFGSKAFQTGSPAACFNGAFNHGIKNRWEFVYRQDNGITGIARLPPL
jgi:hypothetical protein